MDTVRIHEDLKIEVPVEEELLAGERWTYGT